MTVALPWQKGRAIADGPVVVSVTRLRLHRWRDVPPLLWDAVRLRRRFADVDGGIRLALVAAPVRRTFWTVTIWSDVESLAMYVRSPGHRDVMRQFRAVMDKPSAARWTDEAGAAELRWQDAIRSVA